MNILLVDDNRYDRALVVRELQKEFPTVIVTEILDADALDMALATDDFDLVITDYQLQWSTGSEVLRLVKQKFPDRPVIMFTGTGNEVIAVEAMKAGLDDYVIKSAKHFVRLPFSIKQALEKARLRLAEKESAITIAKLNNYRELVLNAVADGILGIDKNGCHSYANPAAQQMLGYTVDELLGRDSHTLWHKFHRDGSLYLADTCPVHNSLQEEKTFFGKDFFWRKDGSGFAAEYASAPIFENGVCLGAVIIFRDISEQERAQEELRKYRQIVSASDEMMAFIGTNLEFQAVNDAYLQAYNWTREEVIGHSISELVVDQAVVATMTRSLGQAMQGQMVSSRDWFDLPDQGKRFMDVAFYPYKTQDSVVSGVVVNLRDITDLKQQEDALRLAEQEWKHTFDSISDLVSIHDPSFRFLKVNKTLADFVGKPAEELIGKHCYEIFHGLSHPWPNCPHQEALVTACPVTIDIDDKQIGHPLLVTASPILDELGHVVATIHIAKDITELKKAEQERQDLQAKLSQAQKMECLGQLVGGVAHDFNNLLSAIIGFSDLILLKHPNLTIISEDVNQIKQAGMRSAALVKQLLAFSRKQVLEMGQVKLDALVENLAKMLLRLLGGEIVLDFQLGAGASVIFADPVQIEQVIMNLVVNARDAMPDGGCITIRTEHVTVNENQVEHFPGLDSGQYIQLTVSDTGTGIKPEDRSHLFDPFFTTKGVGKGTGLGLATVHGIIAQHKGWVDFESEVGKGATFRILLPTSSQHTQKADANGDNSIVSTGNETILLVDDEPIVRSIIMRLLNILGYRVLDAASASEALDIVDQNRGGIDLLITDVIMPEQRGTVLAEQVNKRFPQIKILFISGYSDERITNGGILKPGVNFLKKPVTLQKLGEMVRHVLDNNTIGE